MGYFKCLHEGAMHRLYGLPVQHASSEYCGAWRPNKGDCEGPCCSPNAELGNTTLD